MIIRMSVLGNILTERLVLALASTFAHSLWIGAAAAIIVNIAGHLWKSSAKIRYTIAGFGLIIIMISVIAVFIHEYNTCYSGEIDGMASAMMVSFEPAGALTNSINLPAESKELFTGLGERINAFLISNSTVLVLFWILGITLLGIKNLSALIALNSLRRSGLNLLADRWTDRVKDLCGQIGVRKTVKIFETVKVKVPMVTGWLKPVILLPAGLCIGIPANQLELVLAHEIAHIKRNDFILNIFQTLVEVLLFFNPSVWWISGLIREERENICDDLALSTNNNRIEYARALLFLQEDSNRRQRLAVALTGRKSELLNRIKRITIMSNKKYKQGNMFLSAAITLLLMACFSIVTGLKAPEHSNDFKIVKEGPAEVTDAIEYKTSRSDFSATKEISSNALYQDTVRIKNINSGTIKMDWIDPADNIEKKVEMKLDNGKVLKLMIDDQEIPKSEYGTYQDLIDDTLEDLEEIEKDLIEAQEDLEDALEDIEDIDFEEIEAEMEEIDFEEIEREMQEALEDIEDIDIAEMELEIQEAIEELEAIDYDHIYKEMGESMREWEFEIQEYEQELEIVLQNWKVDIQEYQQDMQKAIEEMEAIDIEKMKEEVEVSREEMMTIDIDKLKSEMEQNMKEMEKQLKEFSKNKEVRMNNMEQDFEKQKEELKKQLIEIQAMKAKKKEK